MRTYSAGIATAYGSAVRGGYEGTYEEFCEALGQLADVLEDFEGFSVSVTTLAEGSSATASYDNGVLTLGIPKGDTGATGNGIASAVLNSDYTLTLSFTDGTSYTTPSIRGVQGEQGIQGVKGDTGNGIASVVKTGTVGLVDTYTITYTDGTTFTFDVTNGQDGEVTEESLEQTLESYALIDGYYEEMSVGDAEQLVATQYVEDSEPYLFRTTGGSADVGNREYVDEIVGGTVGWNQQISNGDFSDGTTGWGVPVTGACSLSASNGICTVTALVTPSAIYTVGIGRITAKIPVKKDHKYLFKCTSKCEKQYQLYRAVKTNTTSMLPANTWNDDWFVYTPTEDKELAAYWSIYNYADFANGDSVQFKDFVTFDLTQMFSSTIADYIYSLEQATAGAGVAWFKKLFPKDYYEYNAGELISVGGISEHKTVGFNQWDEEWETGRYNITTGAKTTSATSLRCANRISVIPGAQYYVKTPVSAYFVGFDASGDCIGILLNDSSQTATKDKTITMPSNCHELVFYCDNYQTYNNDICINLSWSGYRNGEYEEYQKHSYALDDSLTLRGIPKLDSSNNLYYDGDTYALDGTVTRKYGIVDLGTLTWEKSGIANRFHANLPTAKKFPILNTAGTASLICEHYITVGGTDGYNAVYDYAISGAFWNNENKLCINDSAKHDTMDASQFKVAMSGVYLVYELSTPTTESAEPYQQVQICDDFGTEEFVSTSIVPVGHNTRYPDNLRDKLQHLPSLAGADGYYMISQQNNSMSLELFRIPKAPTSPDGTYVLKATVSGGTPTYSWVAEE